MLLYPYTQNLCTVAVVIFSGGMTVLAQVRLDLGVIMMASLMLVGVFRRAALSRATLQRQSLFSLHRSSRPPAPLSLHFSTSARLRIQRGPEPGHVTAKEQRRKDWMVVRRLIGNVWPKHDWNTRFRVVLGFALLLGGKVPLPLHSVRA
jgi:hypothetical protein